MDRYTKEMYRDVKGGLALLPIDLTECQLMEGLFSLSCKAGEPVPFHDVMHMVVLAAVRSAYRKKHGADAVIPDDLESGYRIVTPAFAAAALVAIQEGIENVGRRYPRAEEPLDAFALSANALVEEFRSVNKEAGQK